MGGRDAAFFVAEVARLWMHERSSRVKFSNLLQFAKLGLRESASRNPHCVRIVTIVLPFQDQDHSVWACIALPCPGALRRNLGLRTLYRPDAHLRIVPRLLFPDRQNHDRQS